jgi:hypothetical protein
VKLLYVLARRKKIFSAAGDDVIKRGLEIVAARLEDSTSRSK